MLRIFGVRLDHYTYEKLSGLAILSHRSRGGVIRWLILNAQIGDDLSSPQITHTSNTKRETDSPNPNRADIVSDKRKDITTLEE